MSHHFDSPTAIEDGRLNLCDLYAFPGPSDTSTLILTTNPDAGRSSPTTFRPDALYEFVIASDGGTVEDRAVRMVFTGPGPDGQQEMQVLYADGESSRRGVAGLPLGSGAAGEVFRLEGGGVAWFGTAADPFWADGVALALFVGALEAGDYRPELFGPDPSNIFAGRNVTAIALQLPNSTFHGRAVSLWARISLYGHAEQKQVSRFGNPMVRPLFFPVPGPDAEALNAGSPADDATTHAARLEQVATNLATLRDFADPAGHARSVVGAFLPDVLTLRPGQPARYQPGTGNGRALHDDAFGTALTVLNGSPLGITPSPHPVVPEFPHLLPADDEDLPSLADLFGLRPLAPGRERGPLDDPRIEVQVFTSSPDANPMRGTASRVVPVGSERDVYLPLFRLADDSVEQVLGYYQSGTLFALDTREGMPLGIVLAIDGTDQAVELKAVAVHESFHGQGVGTRMLVAVLEKLRSRGVERVVVGTSSSGIGQLAYYQKAGFRLAWIERDFFNAARGYPEDLYENGIPVRDMVWMDLELGPRPS